MQPVSPRTATPRDAPMRAPAGITVTPLSPACGAEIGGVDLTRELSPATVQAIRQAWAEHLVLVFRGQDITQEQQLRFASYFGELGNRKKAPEPLRVGSPHDCGAAEHRGDHDEPQRRCRGHE